jgi:CheY-like chemotaxis protein
VTAKRALIVDDSKSARVVLSRLLEKHNLAVHATDSAESALLYLRDNRPDVIFMDHVMSGMDGLSAVQHIKGDPGTASIPIMMYTSQEGELYAGEARAAGAVGVLAKRLGPADIAAALYDLALLPDHRVAVAPVFDQVQVRSAPPVAVTLDDGARVNVNAQAAPEEAGSSAEPPAAPVGPPPLTADAVSAAVAPLFQEQTADLRRLMVTSLEGLSSRLEADGAALSAALQAALASREPPAPAPNPPPRSRRAGWMTLSALVFFGAVAAVAALLAWREHRDIGELTARIEADGRTLAEVRRDLEAARREARQQVPVQRLAVGYGEPLYGAHQIEALGILLQDLEKRGYAGTVAVTASLGDFCLTGNPAEGYALAPGEMPANRCDLIGNPAGDLQKSPERLPASLASLIAGVRTRTAGAIDVRVDTARRPAAEVAVPADPSAAQWNAAATARNFVEFTVGPKKSPP